MSVVITITIEEETPNHISVEYKTKSIHDASNAECLYASAFIDMVESNKLGRGITRQLSATLKKMKEKK